MLNLVERSEERKNAYGLTSITNRGIKERLERIWNNPDAPIKPKFELASVANSEIKVAEYIYAVINYSGREYTCYFAWRDRYADSKMDGAMKLHPENKDLWTISTKYKDGFKEDKAELPLPVVEALLYEVAKQLATKCPYVPETYIKEA